VGIGYGDSIDQAMAIIQTVIAADERALEDPAPQIVVGELADSSVNLVVRVWVAANDYWLVKFDLTKNFKEELDEGGITIPFPQRDLHLIDHVSEKTAIG
jgi:small conductance mechanosensitive channel